jgi:NADP-dependent 3-hydroxy acid dehydrogenase YdfG
MSSLLNTVAAPGSLLHRIVAKCEDHKWAVAAGLVALVPVYSLVFGGSGREFIKPSERSNKVVVITGCDTGFGFLLSQELHKQGFLVVAACLTKEGCASLTGKVTLTVQCDVTSQDSLNNLAFEVDKLLHLNSGRTYKLWAVVNNAGIGSGGNIDWLSMKAVRQVMEVNFFGVVGTTKTLLPLLKQCKNSRIVNLSSLAGLSGDQMLNAYCGECGSGAYTHVFVPTFKLLC